MNNLAEKQEYYGQNIKRGEVCFELGLIKKETNLMDDINGKNILSNHMKLENRQPGLIKIERFDESNQIKKAELIKGGDDMSRNWNEKFCTSILASQMATKHAVKGGLNCELMSYYNTMAGCTSKTETTTIINTTPTTSTGSATIHTTADNGNQRTSTRALRPWWNDECKDARHLRRKALRKFNKKPSSEHLEKFKQERAKARRLFRQSRKECWAINVADY